MYKNILVGVPMGAAAHPDKLIAVARVLADKGAKLTLIHVIEQIPSYATTYLPAGFHENNVKAVLGELEALALPVPGAKAVVIDGHAGRTLLDYAAKHGADCIVVGSHKPEMADYLLGSTAGHIARHAKCSVHVVR
jgi:universal stress protein F